MSFRPEGHKVARSGEICSNRFLDSPIRHTRRCAGLEMTRISALIIRNQYKNMPSVFAFAQDDRITEDFYDTNLLLISGQY